MEARPVNGSGLGIVHLRAAGTPVSLVPEHSGGWFGLPGLRGHRAGADWSPRFVLTSVEIGAAQPSTTGGRLTIHSTDDAAGLSMTIAIELTQSGLLRQQATIRNEHPESRYHLDGSLGSACRVERQPPLLCRTAAVGRRGRGWWRSTASRRDLSRPSRGIRDALAYASYGRGLDPMASRFHSSLRSLPGHAGGGRLRPVILNTWEAMYFNHEVNRRRILAAPLKSASNGSSSTTDGSATGETCTGWSLRPRTTLSSRWLPWRRGSLRHLDA
jgi:hypothetical protein